MSEKKERESKMPDVAVSGPAVVMPGEISGPIGHQLRQVYDRLLAEPLPDKFNDLLAKLASSSPETGK